MKHSITLADSTSEQLATKLRTNGFHVETETITGGTDAYGIYQRVGVVVMFSVMFPSAYSGGGYLNLPIKMDEKFAGSGVIRIYGYYTTWGAFTPQTGDYLYPSTSRVYLPDPTGFTNYTASEAIQVSGWYIAG
jgi:hypothetical protein